jgi:hypothetical protein
MLINIYQETGPDDSAPVATDISLRFPAVNAFYVEWKRKAFDSGSFRVRIPTGLVEQLWPTKFLVEIADRIATSPTTRVIPEIGVVFKIKTHKGSDGEYTELSGVFGEGIWGFTNTTRGTGSSYGGWYIDQPSGTKVLSAMLNSTGDKYMTGLPKYTKVMLEYENWGGRTRYTFGSPTVMEDAIYDLCKKNDRLFRVPLFKAESGLYQLMPRTQAIFDNTGYVFSEANGNVLSADFEHDTSTQASLLKGFNAEAKRESSAKCTGHKWQTTYAFEWNEDVSDLMGNETTQEACDAAAALRSYNYNSTPTMSIDVSAEDYRTKWDLGDRVAYDVLGYTGTEIITEVNESYSGSDVSIGVTIGAASPTRMQRLNKNVGKSYT